VAAQRGADRSRRDSYTNSLELALDALVAPARVLLGETDDRLLDLVVKRWSPLSMMRVGPSPATRRRCQRNSVSGFTKKHHQRTRGSARLTAASRAVGGLEPRLWDLTTQHRQLMAQHQDLQILDGLARASSTSSWVERQSVR
jgi:hypothetical protein